MYNNNYTHALPVFLYIVQSTCTTYVQSSALLSHSRLSPHMCIYVRPFNLGVGSKVIQICGILLAGRGPVNEALKAGWPLLVYL